MGTMFCSRLNPSMQEFHCKPLAPAVKEGMRGITQPVQQVCVMETPAPAGSAAEAGLCADQHTWGSPARKQTGYRDVNKELSPPAHSSASSSTTATRKGLRFLVLVSFPCQHPHFQQLCVWTQGHLLCVQEDIPKPVDARPQAVSP